MPALRELRRLALRQQAEVIPSLEAVSAHSAKEIAQFLRAYRQPYHGNKDVVARRLWEFIHPPPPPDAPIPPINVPNDAPVDGLNLGVADAAPANLGGVRLTQAQFEQYQQYLHFVNNGVPADPAPPVPPPPPPLYNAGLDPMVVPHAGAPPMYNMAGPNAGHGHHDYEGLGPIYQQGLAPMGAAYAAPVPPFYNAGPPPRMQAPSVADSALFDNNEQFYGPPAQVHFAAPMSSFEKEAREFMQNLLFGTDKRAATLHPRMDAIFGTAAEDKKPYDVLSTFIRTFKAYTDSMNMSSDFFDRMVDFPPVTVQLGQLLLLPASGLLPHDGGAKLDGLKTSVTVFQFMKPNVTEAAYQHAIDEHLELLLTATFSNRAHPKSSGKGSVLYSGGLQRTVDDLRALVANLRCYCSFWIAARYSKVQAVRRQRLEAGHS
jgi:hypothetical protein